MQKEVDVYARLYHQIWGMRAQDVRDRVKRLSDKVTRDAARAGVEIKDWGYGN